jgi:hypothetical protein
MILSVRALSPRAAWAANVSAALPFVNRIVILLHSNWKNNFRSRRFLLFAALHLHCHVLVILEAGNCGYLLCSSWEKTSR